MIETEEANADEDGDAARVVEDEEEDLRSCWIVRECSRAIAIQSAFGDHYQVIGAGEVDIEKETDEITIVVMTDAIIDPGAVMIHP